MSRHDIAQRVASIYIGHERQIARCAALQVTPHGGCPSAPAEAAARAAVEEFRRGGAPPGTPNQRSRGGMMSEMCEDAAMRGLTIEEVEAEYVGGFCAECGAAPEEECDHA